ncbi:Uncharacterised protein [Legionella lansingensis]|uniref:DUF4785 domain-containing protein n=1 Tax=Legionella lansingensis TaxID=45067 RepID=A0A0W0VJV2_9GAMM|nr:DUF4785 domain-containing protein [Legionella lansingensis]KTD20386.1 hypothetical protein Llan_1887 [Legionella lansingensis]SNV51569.1 Uncharacterised protein [Legionella lansingensis]
MKTRHLMFLSILWLTQLHAITLPTAPVTPYDCKQCEGLSHDELNTSWLTEDKPFDEEIIHSRISRKFRIKATAEQLNKGVVIYTQAPSAVIHITSASQLTSKPEFYITSHKGEKLKLQEASSLFSKDESLQNTVFSDGLLALQLKEEVGAGRLILSSTPGTLKGNEGPFIISVYDKDAPTYLKIETDKARYRHGDQLKLTVRLSDKDFNYPIDDINATLISPTGDPIELNLKQTNDNLYEAKVDLQSDKNSQGENWYIEVETSTVINNETIVRHAHTAFSYVIPSAAIRKIKTQIGKPFSFSAKVEVATGSRYAVEAVLFGSDAQGALHPITTVQSAAWLAPGKHDIHFSFDSDLKSDYKAPYYVGYLHLIDFGQLKPVYEHNQPIELTALG